MKSKKKVTSCESVGSEDFVGGGKNGDVELERRLMVALPYCTCLQLFIYSWRGKLHVMAVVNVFFFFQMKLQMSYFMTSSLKKKKKKNPCKDSSISIKSFIRLNEALSVNQMQVCFVS